MSEAVAAATKSLEQKHQTMLDAMKNILITQRVKAVQTERDQLAKLKSEHAIANQVANSTRLRLLAEHATVNETNQSTIRDLRAERDAWARAESDWKRERSTLQKQLETSVLTADVAKASIAELTAKLREQTAAVTAAASAAASAAQNTPVRSKLVVSPDRFGAPATPGGGGGMGGGGGNASWFGQRPADVQATITELAMVKEELALARNTISQIKHVWAKVGGMKGLTFARASAASGGAGGAVGTAESKSISDKEEEIMRLKSTMDGLITQAMTAIVPTGDGGGGGGGEDDQEVETISLGLMLNSNGSATNGGAESPQSRTQSAYMKLVVDDKEEAIRKLNATVTALLRDKRLLAQHSAQELDRIRRELQNDRASPSVQSTPTKRTGSAATDTKSPAPNAKTQTPLSAAAARSASGSGSPRKPPVQGMSGSGTVKASPARGGGGGAKSTANEDEECVIM